MKNSIVVATFTYPHEYAVLKLLLEKEAIPFFFENETMIGVFPFYSNALGGINLRVHKENQKRVLQIIQDLNTNNHLKIV